MLNTLKELCLLNGVSGDEDEVRRYLVSRIKPRATHFHADAIGNLIVFKKGKKSTGNRLMLAAHMDEVGIIVTRITEDGFLKFDFVGGVDRRVAIGKPVVIGEKKVPGVIGLKAVHLVSREERKKAPKTESLYIDIGAKDKASAEKLVEPGDYGAFVCQPEEFGDGLFKAKAIDDRVGCAIMLKLLEEDLPLDVTFAFTAQEEVGTRGAAVTARVVKPDLAIVFEGCPADDTCVEPYMVQTAIKRGPMLRHMDARMITNPRYQRFALDLAAEEGRARTEQSFLVPREEIVENGYDLSINKYKKTEYVPVEYPPANEIFAELRELETEISKGLEELEGMV